MITTSKLFPLMGAASGVSQASGLALVVVSGPFPPQPALLVAGLFLLLLGLMVLGLTIQRAVTAEVRRQLPGAVLSWYDAWRIQTAAQRRDFTAMESLLTKCGGTRTGPPGPDAGSLSFLALIVVMTASLAVIPLVWVLPAPQAVLVAGSCAGVAALSSAGLVRLNGRTTSAALAAFGPAAS